MVRGELKRVRLLWIKAIPTNKRQPRSERTLARTLNGQKITENDVHKDWDNTQE
jgi:hypothetical protein